MDQQLSEQEQQDITSTEPNILEITEEEFQFVFGGSNNWSGYTGLPPQAQFTELERKVGR